MLLVNNKVVKKQGFSKTPLTAAICLAISAATFTATGVSAQEAPATTSEEERKGVLDTVTVTAQKRTENLQEVPISIQVLGEQKLDEMRVSDFDDYAKLIPSLAYTQGEGGSSTPYFRGVVSGGDGNHSGSAPSVGVYLDEQPVTTIGGALNIHIYDIERIEALAGPQGTLYGASSQSGTLKIITNKPDATAFAAGYALELNSVTDGGTGYVAEGFINVPLSEKAAIRLVAWDQENAGWIDNVYGERTFPTSDVTIDNANFVEEDYNDSSNMGARLALKLDLGENWSILPSIMTQTEKVNGSFAFDPEVGDRQITRYFPEKIEDEFTQAALTIMGKIGTFDLTYTYNYMDRDIDTQSDYNDYSFWYDTVYNAYYAGAGCYYYEWGDCIQGNNGDPIMPAQYIHGVDKYKNYSQELRIASDQDQPLRFIGGIFWQKQTHDIQQRYLIDNLSDSLNVTGWDDTLWLTKQLRTDKQTALFGELSYDFTEQFTTTAGFRYFQNDNNLKGFFGFGQGFNDLSGFSSGETSCISEDDFETAPCTSFNKTVEENGWLGKVNMTYEIDDKKLIYGTWSQGYRPGGINRRGSLPPYLADYLTNWELGWKTSWMDNRLTFNGALFREEWEDFQFSILGGNGLTEIKNANQAQIDGLEMDINWAVNYNLSISAGVAFYDAKLTANFCGWTTEDGTPVTYCPAGTEDPDGNIVDGPEAPDGARLPVTSEFKGNLIARYTFDWKDYEPFIQGALLYEGDRTSDLRTLENSILGNLPSYTLFDLSAGISKNNWTLNLYVKNLFDDGAQFNRFTMCGETICGASGFSADYPNGQVYTVATQPRTIGLRFSQEF